jgi:hypothetical protein
MAAVVTGEVESKDTEDRRRLAGDSQAPRRRSLKVEREYGVIS